ncbi:DUF998 domain-containing protein [Shewanella sairae]|uniref:DUF998 domain-containing protein n=1 Tax=Shewanella sairae TaxID=190310 RepID=A0ABQ4PBP4_9GAMM|nr:DUF998 domain-containing protein [Shewanella sairae]MCL1129914.1 DUF998 domain-containing protein [Shewanella sairae]GIU44950.1 DUF998 domain-containing protein [Shewanella sairae]
MLVKKYNKVATLAFRFGMLGIFGQLLGLVLSVMLFKQIGDDGFSFFNHTLSELGSYGQSHYAVFVNGGLFFGGLCVVLFCLLSLQLVQSRWHYLFFLSLGLCYLAFAASGLFPVNVYHLHIVAIKYFFIFACSSLVFYGLFQLSATSFTFSIWHNALAFFAFIFLAGFLLLPSLGLGLTEGNEAFYNELLVGPGRPDLWWPAIIEWIGVATFSLWSCSVIYKITSSDS